MFSDHLATALTILALAASLCVSATCEGTPHRALSIDTARCVAVISNHTAPLAQSGLDSLLATDASKELLVGSQIDSCRISQPLDGHNLTGARIRFSDLSDVSCKRCFGSDTWFDDSNLDYIDFTGGTFHSAKFRGHRGSLRNATFNSTVLDGSLFDDVDLDGARFWSADVSGVTFMRGTVPNALSLAHSQHLELAKYSIDDPTLFKLRKLFREFGADQQERDLTFAIESGLQNRYADFCRQGEAYGRRTATTSERLQYCFLYVVKAVAFGFTCDFGRSPWKPLLLLFHVWLVSTVVLALVVLVSSKRLITVAIRRTFADKTRVRELPLKFFLRPDTDRLSKPKLKILFCALLIKVAARLSLMNLFNLQFHELDVGRWLKLISGRDYEIRAFGVARSLSGIESLISFYLIGLWVLVYFAHPFLQ